MNIVPTRVQEQINRVDRTPSLVIAISSGLTAIWSLYQVFWLIYTATVLSNVGWSPVSLVFPFVLWTVIGVVAAIAAFAFYTRYAKQALTCRCRFRLRNSAGSDVTPIAPVSISPVRDEGTDDGGHAPHRDRRVRQRRRQVPDRRAQCRVDERAWRRPDERSDGDLPQRNSKRAERVAGQRIRNSQG